MKIKVCGITREEDIVKLLELKVDFIGFNLLQESKRKVSIDWALDMTQKYQLKHESVFLVDCEQPEFQRLKNVTSHNLQIYNFLEIPIVSNTLFIPVNATFLKQLEQPHSRNKKNHRYLIDNMDSALGGTGKKFDWSNLDNIDLSNLMIAGGLSIEDIPTLKDMGAWGVDLNSKLEIAPGIKDPKLIEQLGRYYE